MKQKALTLGSKPSLAKYYEEATELIYKKRIIVVKKYYQRFLELERKLHSRWIYPKDYAFGLCERLPWWVKLRGLTHIPINVFCGDWAVGYYDDNIGNRQFYQPSNEKELQAWLLYNELTVARLYIQENRIKVTRLSSIVEELREVLAPEWIKLYESKKRTAIIVAALDALSDETGHYVRSYEELFING